MSKRTLLIALLAAFSTILLPLYFDVGPDLVQNITLVQCFSTQFWQGDWYPRWCDATNAGYGSPIFIAYYPLAYYITAIFWPLKTLGLGIKGMIMLSALAAGLVSFLSCYHWLRNFSNHKIALLCAFIYLWLPYRMEVMYFRPSLPELWLIAFLPLLFHYTRQLALHPAHKSLMLPLVVAVCLLTQIPTTLNVLFICGIYVLLFSWPKYNAAIHYFRALLAGVAMVLFYIVPAAQYRPFLSDEMNSVMQHIWVCRHMLWQDWLERPYVMLNFSLTALALVAFGLLGLKRIELMPQEGRREYKILLACALVAFFMLIPISEPLWQIWRATGVPGMPWRMQFVIGFVLVYAIAVYANWQMSDKRKKTATGDYVTGMAALVFLSLLFLFQHSPEEKLVMQRIVDAQAIQFGEHFPRWVDKEHRTLERIIDRHENQAEAAIASLPSGAGHITESKTDNGRIQLSLDIKKESTLTINQYFYPILYAPNEKGTPLIIQPTEGSGLMSLKIEKGAHNITISRDVYKGSLLLQWCQKISLVAFLIWLGAFWISRRASKA